MIFNQRLRCGLIKPAMQFLQLFFYFIYQVFYGLACRSILQSHHSIQFVLDLGYQSYHLYGSTLQVISRVTSPAAFP